MAIFMEKKQSNQVYLWYPKFSKNQFSFQENYWYLTREILRIYELSFLLTEN
jgi:hypothetical protein